MLPFLSVSLRLAIAAGAGAVVALVWQRSLKVAARFAEQGYAAYLPDLAGHGRSSGSWAVVSSMEELASDLAFLAQELARLHPNLPVLLQVITHTSLLSLPFSLSSFFLSAR